DVQADGGDAAICVAADGLLAAQSAGGFLLEDCSRLNRREVAAFCASGGFGGRYTMGHQNRWKHSRHRDRSFFFAAGECSGLLCPLPGKDVLAGRNDRLLSDAKGLSSLASDRINYLGVIDLYFVPDAA